MKPSFIIINLVVTFPNELLNFETGANKCTDLRQKRVFSREIDNGLETVLFVRFPWSGFADFCLVILELIIVYAGIARCFSRFSTVLLSLTLFLMGFFMKFGMEVASTFSF